MNILHGTWLPTQTESFYNQATFVFWVEKATTRKVNARTQRHPFHLKDKAALLDFYTEQLRLKIPTYAPNPLDMCTIHISLPSDEKAPLPSPELAQFSGYIATETPQWRTWTITGFQLESPFSFFKHLRYLQTQHKLTFGIGHDLQFWLHYTQHLTRLIQQHQYLPQLKAEAMSTKAKQSQYAFHTIWTPVGENYEQGLQHYAQYMPLSCRCLFKEYPQDSISTESKENIPLWDAKSLLRHFSEQQVNNLVSQTLITQKLAKPLANTWLAEGFTTKVKEHDSSPTQKDWKQAQYWRQRILGDGKNTGFILSLQLFESEADNEQEAQEDWLLLFLAESRQDPSLKLSLEEIWGLNSQQRKTYAHFLGEHFERDILIALGQAARICPLLWDGLETEKPIGLPLTLNQAYAFLKNDAEILSAAGFKIVLPAWWTPKGRLRARMRVKASSSSAPTQVEGQGYFSLPNLVQYRYSLSIGDQTVSEEEWQTLVNAKSPLVQFRGQWMELDSQHLNEMLALWQQQEQNVEHAEAVNFNDLLKQIAEADEDSLEFVFDEVLEDMMQRITQRQQMPELDSPKSLQGELRAYQKTGLSWLATQEALGLNPCLADDMGLGKTIQMIALLLHEREQLPNLFHPAQQAQTQPNTSSLLIAPTSVLGNWQKEIERFAPSLRSLIHHGSKREKEAKVFQQALADYDVIITSFTLARKDSALLQKIHWRRVVVDEAQTIKNPKSAQTKAIQKLKAQHRIAMTGTPIENRLMDLWSIFHFLNPGYLGTAAQFKRAYETPVQRDNNTLRSEQLKKLVHPFILRRLKTDKQIINDLPDKIEQKVYCNLTQEQASLYQAVVDDVQEQLEESEGIQRKGLILSTLMKLKQICNHPAQFLQDESHFKPERSHKLSRVNEMIEEVLEEGNSLLVFTQFTEVGGALEKQLRKQYQCPVYYLHGSTSRKKREAMITTFQDETTAAGIFILSLKAGGVGITLTRANHVFHFDRWWNPAVENQATDRAFRIGQKKKVFAHKMVTLGTLEERIDKMLEDKQALAESIVGKEETWLTEMDNEAFRSLIQLNRNTILEA